MTAWWLALALGCAPPTAPDPTVDEVVAWAQQGASAGSISMAGRGIADATFARAVVDPSFPSVRSLTAPDNRLGASALAALGDSGRCEGLTWLNLTRNPVGDAGAAALAAGPCGAALERLFVAEAGLGPAGATSLAALPSLSWLSIGGQPLGDAGATSLAAAPSIAHLEIPHAEVGGAGARALISGTAAHQLVLDGNPIGPEGLVGLTALAPTLTHLSRADAGLSDADVDVLARLPRPAGLERLTLSGNSLSDDGLASLAAAPWLGELDKLEIARTGTSLDARTALVAAWGSRAGLDIERR